MRGKDFQGVVMPIDKRITPAHAGKCKLASKIQKMKKGGKRWVKEKKPRKVTVYRDILSEQK